MIRSRRGPIVWALVLAVVTAGCGSAMPPNPHDHGGGMVAEVRPAWRAVERPAPASAVVVLYRWQPLPPPVAAGPGTDLLRPATRPAATAPRRPPRRERAVEVGQVFVLGGEPVGFRRRADGLLVAVAGATTRPLTPGHYCWHLLPGNPTALGGGDAHAAAALDARQTQGGGLLLVGVVVAAVVGLVALPFAIDDVDHHAHLVKSIGKAIDAGADGD